MKYQLFFTCYFVNIITICLKKVDIFQNLENYSFLTFSPSTLDLVCALLSNSPLQNVLSGANDHNQPQIFRRLFKAEFKAVTKEEFTKYLDDLEKLLVIQFTADVKNELFALCTDVENGGLGIFIYLLENTLLFVRPEWEEICLAHRNGDVFDTSALTTSIIDKDMLRQSSRFQMKK